MRLSFVSLSMVRGTPICVSIVFIWLVMDANSLSVRSVTLMFLICRRASAPPTKETSSP